MSANNIRPIIHFSLSVQLGIIFRIAYAEAIPKNGIHCSFSCITDCIIHTYLFLLIVVTRIRKTIHSGKFIVDVMHRRFKHNGDANFCNPLFGINCGILTRTTATTLDCICVRCIIHRANTVHGCLTEVNTFFKKVLFL